ncbi:MAG: DUF4118 domain-containing protein [Methanoregulaceae archaeon]|nr:DUF4118 domain-containing protein [Methanoregulaceae archaeon]
MARVQPEEPERPSPEAMLALARETERQACEGRLTIYLGYAAGVGKTYAMLHDALQRRREGTDMVIGYVETHGRPETDALAARLEKISTKATEYQGLRLEEMDLDAVLKRHPDIVLVDELAHTDAPGSRHVKRYQDIEELLHAGISVWTTINIQHIESLNDPVFQITRISVSETVPDTFVTAADEIRLVDLSPEELQIRLKAGKIYVRDLADTAIARFFGTGNLLALRQLALRYVATDTDLRMVNHMKARAIVGPWPASERLLVCVRPGPNAGSMVRSAYRLSQRFNADWVVLSVSTEEDLTFTAQERVWLTQAMDTARELGGRIIRYRGDDIANEIVRYARQNNVTMIMLGKPRGLDLIFSPVYPVLRRSKGIDIYLYDPKHEAKPIPFQPHLPNLLHFEYLISIVLIATAAAANFFIRGIINPSNMLFIQLLPVIVTAFFFRRRTAIFTAIVSIIIFDFTFVSPYYTFRVSDWEYFISFIGYVVIAFVISTLATRLRNLIPQIWRSAAEVEAVSGLSRDLAVAQNRQDIYDTLLNHMRQYAPGTFAVLVPEKHNLVIQAGDDSYPMNDKERSIAQWAFDNAVIAGRGTENLPSGTGHYVPMTAHSMVFGVLGFVFEKPDEMLTPDRQEVLKTMAFWGAMALERV